MSIDSTSETVSVTKMTTRRTYNISIATDFGTDPLVTGLREVLPVIDGVPGQRQGTAVVQRSISAVAAETIQLGTDGPTVSVAVLAGAVAALLDRWDQEDLDAAAQT